MTPSPAPRRLLATLAILGAAATAPAAGAPAVGDPVPGEVLVGLAPHAPAAARDALARRAGVRLGARLTPRGARVARVLGPGGTDRALERLRADPAVRWAEPNRWHAALAVPPDPLFPLQWGLRNTGQPVGGTSGTPGADIRATEAWDLTTGSPQVRVAVVDSGVDPTAPDLVPNIGVVNAGESGDGRESNGIDDDGNGLVDDVRGWDFAGDDADPSDDDPDRHGTTVAGVIAARGGDGVGTAGVTWSSRLIPVRGLDAEGLGTTADLAVGITYAAAMGARVLNASFGGPRSTLIEEAIRDAPQVLVVAAAGNGGGDGVGDDNDAGPSSARTYPCALELENLVCVAATDQSDTLARFSNRGAVSVDLAAPGVRILGPPRAGATSATPLSGTSFSAPHVAGVAALVLARSPDAGTRAVRRAVLDGVRPLPSLSGAVATGGRLDAVGALASVPPVGPGPGGVTGPATLTGPASARLTGTVPATTVPLAYHVDYGTTTDYGAVTPSRPLPPGPARAVAEDVDRLSPGTDLHHRLVVEGLAGVTRGADATIRVPAPPAPPPAPPPAAAAAPAAPPARPTARVRRVGARWVVSLTLAERSRVGVVVTRGVSRGGTRRAERLTVRRVRPRTLAAGTRRLGLGTLRPGRHRIVVRVAGSRGTVVIVRTVAVGARR